MAVYKKYKQPSPEAIRVGELIRSYRNAQKITQEQLCSMVDVDVNTIRNIENGVGNSGITTVIAIGYVLTIPADELLYGKISAGDGYCFPEDFQKLDSEDKAFVRRSMELHIAGCLSSDKYQKVT